MKAKVSSVNLQVFRDTFSKNFLPCFMRHYLIVINFEPVTFGNSDDIANYLQIELYL